MLTGRTIVVWEPSPETPFPPGAERLLRFELEERIYLPQAFPFRWTFHEVSPHLENLKPVKPIDPSQPVRVSRKVRESRQITSFYLVPERGKPIPHRPGQFLTLTWPSPNGKGIKRTYTLSNKPGAPYYRISVKRESAPLGRPDLPPGKISNYLHDQVEVGDSLRVLPPAGNFVLDEEATGPLIMISGGVGITPMMSMLESLAQSAPNREVVFVHGARNSRDLAFGKRLKSLAGKMPNLRLHLTYSQPLAKDGPDGQLHGQGRITGELLTQLLPQSQVTVYLCGPSAFMADIHAYLVGRGIPQSHIRTESFGPAKVAVNSRSRAAQPPLVEQAEVTFQGSGKKATWRKSDGDLLTFAESLGLEPAFSCREGSCHTCKVKVLKGSVRYGQLPPNLPADDEALICCSQPAGPLVLDV